MPYPGLLPMDTKAVPTWLQLAVQVVFKFGVPSVIAIYLVWIGATNVPEIRLELAAQRREMQALQATLTNIERQGGEIQLYLQWICSNTSKDDITKRACFQP